MSAVVFEREMSISHREFLRTLASAVEGRDYRVEDGRIEIDDAQGRQIVIDLAPERERRIASMRLPVTDVRYTFDGHDPAAAEAVMRRFEIYFRRGGG